MSKGLYYYKAVSPYKEDITKNCKLTVNEIDSNFLTLKDEDIKSAELDEKTMSVVLTRNNGDKLIVDLSPVLSGTVYDLKVVYDDSLNTLNGGAELIISYSTLSEDNTKAEVTVPIKGLVTVDILKSVINELDTTTTVITDSTLTGDGTIDSPLGLSSLYNGKAAKSVIDMTDGEQLPNNPIKGDKYVTKEYVSDFGFLYDFEAVKKINENLAAAGNGWRVPTKDDWDCLLNSIEPCDYKDHDSAACHQILGKYAGTKLKSTCGWMEQDDCECKTTKPIGGAKCGDDDEEDDDVVLDDEQLEVVKPYYVGTDEYGMRILPAGYSDGDNNLYFKKKSVFWTTTHVYNDFSQDIYVKEFDWNKSGVLQEAFCPDGQYSIRLVKDYNGSNHNDAESIEGNTYGTLLVTECKAIWTTSNFASSNPEYNPVEINAGLNPYKRIVYFINVWNGKYWEKKMMSEGDTITIQEADKRCQYNIDYRVYMEDACNQALVDVNDSIVERVTDRIIEIIDEEREEREKADAELNERIDQEIKDREAADDILQSEIEEETNRAQDVERQIWDALNNEIVAREDVDKQLWDAINDEANRAQEVESDLWEGINNETKRAQEVEAQLWAGINGETDRAQQVEAQLWEAVNNEVSARTEADKQLWEALNNEIDERTKADQELWDGLNDEIERATKREDEIDEQLIDTEHDYVIRVTEGLTLIQKNGNEIKIAFDGDFGTF